MFTINKILILSAHPPLRHSKEAGQRVFFDFITNLSKKNELYLLSFVRDEEMEWGLEETRKLCKEVETVNITLKDKLIAMIKRPTMPILFNARYNVEFREKLQKLLTKHKFDVVHFDWEQMLQYVDEVKPIKKKTLTCHDVISQMYTRKKENGGMLSLFYGYQESRTASLERKYLVRFDTIFTLNPKDQGLLLSLDNRLNVQVLSPYFNKSEAKDEKIKKQFDLAYFGAMNRIENEDAVLWFMEKMYPELNRRFPNLKIAIIGNRPSEKIQELGKANPNIKVTGFVEDPYELIEATSIGVVPLRLGAGIKIKTLETLACGLPVVSTTVGAEGISASNKDGLFIEDTRDGFINKVIELLNDPVAREELGKRAFDFINEHYDFEKNVEIMEAVYQN